MTLNDTPETEEQGFNLTRSNNAVLICAAVLYASFAIAIGYERGNAFPGIIILICSVVALITLPRKYGGDLMGRNVYRFYIYTASFMASSIACIYHFTS